MPAAPTNVFSIPKPRLVFLRIPSAPKPRSGDICVATASAVGTRSAISKPRSGDIYLKCLWLGSRKGFATVPFEGRRAARRSSRETHEQFIASDLEMGRNIVQYPGQSADAQRVVPRHRNVVLARR